jgi:hypothetical protein
MRPHTLDPACPCERCTRHEFERSAVLVGLFVALGLLSALGLAWAVLP